MSPAAAEATRAFRREEWQRAESGFRAVARGDTSDDLGNKQLAAYHLAIVLYRQGDPVRATRAFRAIGRQPGHLKFPEALLWLTKLTREPSVALDASLGLALLPDDRGVIGCFGAPVDPPHALLNEARYWAGRTAYREGRYERARALFRGVHSASVWSPAARACLRLLPD